MQRQYGITRTSDNRRHARTLAGCLFFVLGGAALYAGNAHATDFTASPQHPSPSTGNLTLAAAAQSQAGTTAWTSLTERCTSTNWDAARRECVAVPRAAATAARLFSRIS